jgi:putative tryptophan/tyrosine transport system substrate-binding protein
MTDATAGLHRGGLGGAAVWPLAARAQQPAMPVIGFFSTQSADDFKMATVPFFLGLKETGYVEGQNVAVEYRWAENQYDRLPALAADLVRRRVAVIAAGGVEAALAAKAATMMIPIVFASAGDPVAMGLVASLNRPGANVTGSAALASELAPKQLQLLRELMPKAASFAVLADPAYPDIQSVIADLQAAARTLGLQLIIVYARTDSESSISNTHLTSAEFAVTDPYPERCPEETIAARGQRAWQSTGTMVPALAGGGCL